jgi:hypothetical protein
VAISWCKVASNLDSHPKIIQAGRLGREVFLFALRLNAEPGNPVPGRLPSRQLEPWFVARQLMMPEEEAVTGVTAAVTVGLLAKDGECYLINGFDESWGKAPSSGKQRTAKWRENKQLENSVTNGDARDNGDRSKSHGDARDAREEKRREENKSVAAGDLALATRLILKIIANHPGSVLAKQDGEKKERTIRDWAGHVRLMREQDSHTEAEIGAVIDWCQKDDFWRSNILSAKKLRKQWDALTAQMRRGGASTQTNPIKYAQPTLTFMVGDVEVER